MPAHMDCAYAHAELNPSLRNTLNSFFGLVPPIGARAAGQCAPMPAAGQNACDFRQRQAPNTSALFLAVRIRRIRGIRRKGATIRAGAAALDEDI